MKLSVATMQKNQSKGFIWKDLLWRRVGFHNAVTMPRRTVGPHFEGNTVVMSPMSVAETI